MKTNLLLLFTAIAFLLNTCTEENNPIIDNTPLIDPITNQWTSLSDSDYTFSFLTFDSTVTRGIFSGEENHPVEGSNDLCGFFDGAYVEFDVRRPFGSRTKFKGNFVNSNRLELESSEGQLVLTR
jgi:hypothetical protein